MASVSALPHRVCPCRLTQGQIERWGLVGSRGKCIAEHADDSGSVCEKPLGSHPQSVTVVLVKGEDPDEIRCFDFFPPHIIDSYCQRMFHRIVSSCIQACSLSPLLLYDTVLGPGESHGLNRVQSCPCELTQEQVERHSLVGERGKCLAERADDSRTLCGKPLGSHPCSMAIVPAIGKVPGDLRSCCVLSLQYQLLSSICDCDVYVMRSAQ
jgi:hypothetical protein